MSKNPRNNHRFETIIGDLKRGLQTKDIQLSGRVLDVGFRDGRYFRVLNELGATEIHGVDSNPEIEDSPYTSRDHLYSCKVEDLPEGLQGSFDGVTAFNVTLCSNKPEEVIQQTQYILGLLKPEGYLICTFTSIEKAMNWEKTLDHYVEEVRITDCAQPELVLEIKKLYDHDEPNKYMILGKLKAYAHELEPPKPEDVKKDHLGFKSH